jgi:hypothetical protein
MTVVWQLFISIGIQILMAASTKMAVLWVAAPCSLVEVYQLFRGAFCLRHQGGDRPDDGGSKFVWNVGKLISDHTALHARRQPS